VYVTKFKQTTNIVNKQMIYEYILTYVHESILREFKKGEK
jgi:hypothetical protein